MSVERREQAIAIWLGSTGNGRNPMFNGRRQPSCGGTSRISREALMDPGGRGAARHGPAADGMDLADEPCAAAATQENDFAMMKVRQLRAMTDADDGRVSELLRQQLHHSILAL